MAAPHAGPPLIDTFHAFLEEDDWHPTRADDGPVVFVGFQGEHGRLVCQGVTFEEDAVALFYSTVERTCPPERLGAMTEFVARANSNLYLGNFELDLDEGTVQFKTGIDVQDAELTPALVRNLVYANCLLMDRYLPGIEAVMDSGVSARDAIALVEREEDEDTAVH